MVSKDEEKEVLMPAPLALIPVAIAITKSPVTKQLVWGVLGWASVAAALAAATAAYRHDHESTVAMNRPNDRS